MMDSKSMLETTTSRSKRRVGSSDLFVNVLGLGTAPLGELWDKIPAAEALETINFGFRNHNIRFFDTAPWYGNGMAEARLGMALNDNIIIGGSKRLNSSAIEKNIEKNVDTNYDDDILVVSTKVGRFLDPEPKVHDVPGGPWLGGYDLRVRYDYSYAGILQQHRESCLRLGFSCEKVQMLTIHDLDEMFNAPETVDLYLKQLLGDSGYNDKNSSSTSSLKCAKLGSEENSTSHSTNNVGDGVGGPISRFASESSCGLAALHELKRRNKVKAVGIGCNAFKHGTREIVTRVMQHEIMTGGSGVKTSALDYILLAGPYNLLNQEALDSLLPLCKTYSMSCVIGAPFASGILVKGVKNDLKNNRRGEIRYMYEHAKSNTNNTITLVRDDDDDDDDDANTNNTTSKSNNHCNMDVIIERCAAIEDLCEKYGIKLASAALQFPLFHPRVCSVLCGAKSKFEVEFACSCMDESIPIEFWQELKEKKLIRQDAPILGENVESL